MLHKSIKVREKLSPTTARSNKKKRLRGRINNGTSAMLKMIAIMTGGGLGAASRYSLAVLAQRLTPDNFPFGTLAANLLGSFAIGFLWCSFEGSRLSNEWRLFIFTGFLGGFTTFSTFARETTQLFKVGEWKTALAYLTISNTLGIALVIAGYLLASRVSLWPE